MSPSSAIVFVVDDDESVRGSLKNLIRSVGLASRPSVLPKIFSSQAQDTASCLVLDVRLPHLSGPDVQKRLADPKPGNSDNIYLRARRHSMSHVQASLPTFRDQDLLTVSDQDRETRVSKSKTHMANMEWSPCAGDNIIGFRLRIPPIASAVSPLSRGSLTSRPGKMPYPGACDEENFGRTEGLDGRPTGSD